MNETKSNNELLMFEYPRIECETKSTIELLMVAVSSSVGFLQYAFLVLNNALRSSFVGPFRGYCFAIRYYFRTVECFLSILHIST
jgi:hypothetical protein